MIELTGALFLAVQTPGPPLPPARRPVLQEPLKSRVAAESPPFWQLAILQSGSALALSRVLEKVAAVPITRLSGKKGTLRDYYLANFNGPDFIGPYACNAVEKAPPFRKVRCEIYVAATGTALRRDGHPTHLLEYTVVAGDIVEVSEILNTREVAS